MSKEFKIEQSSFEEFKKMIIDFEKWEKWAQISTSEFAIKSNLDPLKNNIECKNFKKGELTIENYNINDSIVIHHIYGLGGKKASELNWELVKDSKKIKVTLIQNMGVKDKLNALLNISDDRKVWLQDLIYNKVKNLQSILKERKKSFDEKIINLDKEEDTIYIKRDKIDIIHLPKQ